MESRAGIPHEQKTPFAHIDACSANNGFVNSYAGPSFASPRLRSVRASLRMTAFSGPLTRSSDHAVRTAAAHHRILRGGGR